jgi:hypothetical protein
LAGEEVTKLRNKSLGLVKRNKQAHGQAREHHIASNPISGVTTQAWAPVESHMKL